MNDVLGSRDLHELERESGVFQPRTIEVFDRAVGCGDPGEVRHRVCKRAKAIAARREFGHAVRKSRNAAYGSGKPADPGFAMYRCEPNSHGTRVFRLELSVEFTRDAVRDDCGPSRLEPFPILRFDGPEPSAPQALVRFNA